MVNDKRDNESLRHNAPITAKPPILIPATAQAKQGLVVRMNTTGPQLLPADFRMDGPPKPGWADWGVEQFQAVKEFTSAYMRIGSAERSEMEAAITKKDLEALKGLLLLRYAHATFPSNVKAAKTRLSEASPIMINEPRLQSVFASLPPHQFAGLFYSGFFTRETKTARLVMWLTNDNQFIPAIFCPTMKTAMFVASAFRGVAACPNCEELFAPDSERIDKSNGEKYCTAVCGQRYRQKVYRLKLKAKRKPGQAGR